MKIESQDSDVESLLDSSYFHIPRFQRPYSWDEENIADFWNDIISNQTDDYFIGSMVVFKKTKQQFGVVDGQQRLTTITILLCVLRDKFLEIGAHDLAEGVHQLIERKDRNNKDEYVLKTETSFPYFQEIIQKFNEDPDVDVKIKSEEMNLQAAHKKFIHLVNEAIDAVDSDSTIPDDKKQNIKLDKLVSLRDSVFNLKIIFITLENEDDAYIIFETLNTRGKDLALTDLVKNHFAKHLKAKGQVDHTKLKWEGLLDTIHNSSEDISTDTFIYHFWASRYESIPQKKLFKTFKKKVTKSNAKDFLAYLVDDAKLYRSLYETSYQWTKNENEVIRSLGAMNMFKLSQPIPATLSLIRAYRASIIKYARLRDALKAIENFHFQFTAITSSRSSGGISAMYSSFAQKLYDCSSPQDAADEIDALKAKLKKRLPSQDEFKVAFKEVGYTNSNSKQKNLVRYILRKFAEHYQYKYPADFDDLTIEHIHPQSKMNDGWGESIVGSLGNLIYLDGDMNVNLDDKDYKAKRDALIEDHYSLPKIIVDNETWTPTLVEEHTSDMARVAQDEIWKI